jgi:3-deoxy-D-manno-octulosonate 8-phosphate phosphatase (KDO 8-P phosphatase)
VGDDLPDLPVLRSVGLPVAVANATADARAAARHVTTAAGGRGAIREFVEALLRARGEWEAAVGRYLEEDRRVPA